MTQDSDAKDERIARPDEASHQTARRGPVKNYLLHYTASFQCFTTIAARSPEEARQIVQNAIDDYMADGMRHVPEIPDTHCGMIEMDALASSEPNPPLFDIMQVDELD